MSSNKFFITDTEQRYIDAVKEYGSNKAASEALGIPKTSIEKALYRVKKRRIKFQIDASNNSNKILVIPDAQVKDGIDMQFLNCIGKYWLTKKPGIVVCLGDFADMPSLSSYDKGKRGYEGRRYKNDIEAAKTGMKILMRPIEQFNKKQRAAGGKEYKPELYMILGNHEHRITRTTELDPMLYGTIGVEDLEYPKFGWKEIPFLEVIVIKGIAFSHYFTTGLKGMPCATAQQQLNKMHMSCIAGHQQGRQAASGRRADGKRLMSIIAGSSYDHDEAYLGSQGNYHWRGVIMLHNVEDGEFDEVYVPTSYLLEKYRDGKDPLVLCPED